MPLGKRTLRLSFEPQVDAAGHLVALHGQIPDVQGASMMKSAWDSSSTSGASFHGGLRGDRIQTADPTHGAVLDHQFPVVRRTSSRPPCRPRHGAPREATSPATNEPPPGRSRATARARLPTRGCPTPVGPWRSTSALCRTPSIRSTPATRASQWESPSRHWPFGLAASQWRSISSRASRPDRVRPRQCGAPWPRSGP